MPAEKFTKKAKTPKQKRQWEHVYESEKASGADEGTAIKAASGVVKKGAAKGKGKKADGKKKDMKKKSPPFAPHW